MTGLELIVTALAAGASAGVSGAATQAVQDSYAQLKALLGRALKRGEIETLEAEQAAPGVWRAKLEGPVTEAGADRDEQVLAAARDLLDAVAPGRYQVQITDSRGVQVGDHNHQTNHFG
ncbi:hypothetical protein AB0J83_12145 [Actinoplanes sp. NPDC049596]|uniref:hypothetical protein n=1 Tax=unclassified Actinoplanes TaxID=2626549 RepID=UPI003436490A